MLVANKYYSIFLFILPIAILSVYNYLNINSFKFGTSVWCLDTSQNETKLCKFKNICYDPQFKTFLFFLSNTSVIKGFKHYSELQKIQLSSIQHHNQFYANISLIKFENFNVIKELKVYSKSLLMSRFKPNNIMHTIHDDLFPLFLTLEHICLGDLQCMESYHIMFHDNYPVGPFFKLYKLFSEYPPILASKLDPNYILCFKEMLTGLIRDGIFYQYGFKKPHGPVTPTQLSQSDILRFTSFMRNKLLIKSQNGNSQVIIFKREKNRRILNIVGLKKMIEKEYKKLNKKIEVNVISLDLFSNDISLLISAVSQADGLIGMHGAEMIFSLLLKPNSYVIEIFPFAIKPEIVSFIKPISDLDGSNFIYFPWRNMFKNNSIPHPDAHPLFGGISHLDQISQEKIKNAHEVPATECCNNPLFLYHMYQDTYISDEFSNFFHKSLIQAIKYNKSSNSAEFLKKWFYPYLPLNVTCNFHLDKKVVDVSWYPPFNVNGNDLGYSLYIKDEKGVFAKDISTDKTTLEVEVPPGVSPNFEVWISAYFRSNEFKSPDLYLKC